MPEPIIWPSQVARGGLAWTRAFSREAEDQRRCSKDRQIARLPGQFSSNSQRAEPCPTCAATVGTGWMPNMSLGIKVNKVTAVLLADGWHEVADESFKLGSYEFLWSSEEQQQDGEHN
jgi:hypothetical protein